MIRLIFSLLLSTTAVTDGLDVSNSGVSTLQTWSASGTHKATLYDDGTFSNFPAVISTYEVFALLFEDPYGTAGLVFKGNRSSSNTSADFGFYSTNDNRTGPIIEVRAGGSSGFQVFSLTSSGITASGRQGSAPAFLDKSGESGHTSLTVGTGLYVVLLGQFAFDYNGRHGAVTVSNANQMDAGFPFEVNNGGSALQSKVFMVDYQGGIVSFAAVSFADFRPCPSGVDVGTFMHAVDTERFYVCTSDGWKKVLLEGD